MMLPGQEQDSGKVFYIVSWFINQVVNILLY